MEWISVKEKLPEGGQYVLLANHKEADSHYESTVRAARYLPNLPSPERWAVLGRFPGTVHSAHVSHWMPLPDAPSASVTHSHLWEAINGSPDNQRWECKCAALKIREFREGVMTETIYEP